jgi:hypothetical protein
MDFSKSLPRLRVPSERFPLGNGIFLQQLAAAPTPVTISSSAMACAALSSLMVVMPISRRFQIDPWIVEVNASFQVDAKRLDHLA